MKGSLNVATPAEYLEALDEPRKTEISTIHQFIQDAAPELGAPFILGGMIAFAPYHYKYASGREGDWARVMLASNKNYISLYVCAADEKGYLAEQNKDRLPKASIGTSCIRFERWSDLDDAVVAEILRKFTACGFGM